jgi:glycerol-3-phosphate dehydrogenase
MARGGEQVLQHDPSYSRQEVQFITQREKVAHLDDFILRRSLLAMLGRLTRPLLEELAGLMGETLGWSKTQIAEEVDRSLQLLHERYLTDIR